MFRAFWITKDRERVRSQRTSTGRSVDPGYVDSAGQSIRPSVGFGQLPAKLRLPCEQSQLYLFRIRLCNDGEPLSVDIGSHQIRHAHVDILMAARKRTRVQPDLGAIQSALGAKGISL